MNLTNAVADQSTSSKGKPYTWATPWTIELITPRAIYTLRAPFGVFSIHREEEVDFDKLHVSDKKSLYMSWHYSTEIPRRQWDSQYTKETRPEDDTMLSLNIASAGPGRRPIDHARTAKKIYFERKYNSSRDALVPNEVGPVWGGRAIHYHSFRTDYYVIQNPQQYDGQVIVCKENAGYCRLYGGAINENIMIDSVAIPVDDIENWKTYQDKGRALVEAAIIDVQPVEEPVADQSE